MSVFKGKRKFSMMLTEIEAVTKSIQTCGDSLAKCRLVPEVLQETVAEKRLKPLSSLFQYRLGANYIGKDANIVGYPIFESAMVNIRRKNMSELCTKKREADNCLLRNNSPWRSDAENLRAVFL